MRVLVCGGRNFRFAALVADALDTIHAKTPITLLIEGGANGADHCASKWAESRCVPRMTFFADWKKFGKAAGPRRNKEMLWKGLPSLVVAFPGGTGTANMMKQATDAGVKVKAILQEPDTERKEQGA